MLTLQFIPHNELSYLDQESRLKKLISLIKTDKILVLEGGLSPIEEMQLIERTMQQISKDFKGIEICTVLNDKKREEIGAMFKNAVLKMFGYKTGLTIIGPASIVKEIRRDPSRIELLTVNSRRKRK